MTVRAEHGSSIWIETGPAQPEHPELDGHVGRTSS